MNELQLIEKLTDGLPTNPSVVVGPGDDCAVLDIGILGKWQLFKTDAIVEGIHFEPDADPEKIGHKALGRCLSDIAAMAGEPGSAVITIALPKDFSAERISKIYDGINSLARQFDVAIVGGETTTSTGGLMISVAMCGTVAKGKAVLRNGAKVGDAIFVSGELGGAIFRKHLEFHPRVCEAALLASQFDLHSMIDLSDGLAGDLRQITRASGCGAELFSTAIPISRTAKLAAREESSAKPALLAALVDGEDYELLFTAAPGDAVAIKDAWSKAFNDVKLSCIGKITAGPKVILRTENGVRELPNHGYVHFQQS